MKSGQRIYKGDKIGTVGNSGNARKMDPHLHFEVIRSPETLKWNTSGNTGVDGGLHRIDPLPFLSGHTLLGPGYEEADPLEDEEIKEKIFQRMDVDPHIDFDRGIWWLDVTLGGKNVGRIDKHNKEIKLNLSPEEIEEVLRQPPVSSRRTELRYDIRI